MTVAGGPSGNALTQAEVQATFCATLVDEWCRAGVSEAVVCPGSRSTPLALALVRSPLRVTVRLDERGAAFFALGLALSSRRPVVVLTTSGTAAAELHPAVAEASHAGVPLIVCTADRPPELQQVGAPQTMDQARLYGGSVRHFVDPGVAEFAARGTWRSLASRVVAEATAPSGAGPVHLNLPFREPLVADPGELPPGRIAAKPFHSVGRRRLRPVEVSPLDPRRRGVIVAGATRAALPSAALELARRMGWPLFADPRSGLRTSAPEVVAAADAILRSKTLVPSSRK